ncbi:hypothetical protein SAMN04487819_11845 [Actinopolyspora alba]|uniref:Secreted protein n=2 Tax=Actinopolyspora alba TaxID=673379 RepID=A0A1I2BZR8_9ACTN|nr:hypothetical protein SAMN04487819_11845 [Actinopolyspora alba]
MHHERRPLPRRTSGVSTAPRRWSTVLVSTVALTGLLTSPAMAAVPSPTVERTPDAAPVPGSTANSTDEPDLPPKVIKTKLQQAIDPEAVPAVAPRDVGASSPRSGAKAETLAAGDGAPAETPAGCNPVADSDNPHVSGNRSDVSAHAWWYQGDCDNDRATVTACLYEWYTDHTWRRKACNTNDNQKPGRSSSRWLNVRERCDSFARTSWRAHVDVDVNWEVDNPGVSTKQADVDCRVHD